MNKVKLAAVAAAHALVSAEARPAERALLRLIVAAVAAKVGIDLERVVR